MKRLSFCFLVVLMLVQLTGCATEAGGSIAQLDAAVSTSPTDHLKSVLTIGAGVGLGWHTADVNTKVFIYWYD